MNFIILRGIRIVELEIGKVFNDLLFFDKISERTFQRRGINTRSVISSTIPLHDTRDGGSTISRQPKRESLLWDLMVERIPLAPDIARYRRLANALVQLGRMQMQGPQLRSLPNARKYS